MAAGRPAGTSGHPNRISPSIWRGDEAVGHGLISKILGVIEALCLGRQQKHKKTPKNREGAFFNRPLFHFADSRSY
jgi:hypothetical protein